MVKCIVLFTKCDNVLRKTRLGIVLTSLLYIALVNLDPIVWYSYTCLSILGLAFLLFLFFIFELCEAKLSYVISLHS